MMKTKLAVFLLILLGIGGSTFGQGAIVSPKTVLGTVNGTTRPIANATITVCAANVSGLPCSPALSNAVFRDAALTQPLANPFTADANGNYQFAMAQGTYTVTETAGGFVGYSYQLTVTVGGVTANASNNFTVRQTFVDAAVGTAATSFGDSFTAGFGLPSPGTQNWAAVTAAAKGWTLNNQGVSSSLCMDQADFFIPQNPTTSNIYLWMLGFNDMRVNGTSATKQQEYRRCLLAGLAWLGTPSSQRVNATAAGCVAAGTWVPTTAYGGAIGLGATANASTLTCTTPPGSTVYVYAFTQVSNAGTFTVSIDGASYNSIVSGTSSFTETGTVTNVAATRSFAPAAYRFTGLPEQPHTVLITATSANAGTNTVNILGVSVASPTTGTKLGPLVFAASIPRNDATGYAVTCAPTNCNLGSDTAVANYDASVVETVSELASDGLQVSMVDVTNSSVLDPLQAATQFQADHVHPTVLGAQQLANAFISESTALAQPRTNGAGLALHNLPPLMSPCIGLATNGTCPAFNPQTPAKVVFGDAALTAGASTVSGLPFTSSTSYRCGASDGTGANAVKIAYTSASQITITGTGTDVVSFVCSGN